MKRAPLTINRIDKLTCPAGKAQVFLWDSEVPGLAVRATPTRKTFIFQGELLGKTLRVTIGEYPAWRLDAPAGSSKPNARRRARELRGLIDQGIDPRELEKQAKAESERLQVEGARKDVTLADVWPNYIKANAGRWSATHIAAHERLVHRGGEPRVRAKVKVTVPGPLAALLDVRMVELTADRLATWVEKENTTRPTVTALAFRMLRACLNWSDEQPEYAGLVPEGAHAAKKVRQKVAKPKAKIDCLQREQLATWFMAVRQLSPVFSTYLQTLLLTGARREELAGLRWIDVDFQWNSLTIHDKVEGERVIPLTPYVSSLLAYLPRRNEWVFSSPTAESGRIQDPRDAHNRALAVAGLPDLTLHGLRRSFGTLAEWVECPVGVVAQIQGHKPSATAEKHYRRRPLDLLRVWHTKIEGWILEQTGIEPLPATNRGMGLRAVG
ncbi:tyrosine-type recombinase/integrase [Vogesella indigofera]|uniref:tyrosine-type recombinase/integrase n=1 Tax=Vogesella indigofera TaxID=45465 RepID=UPI00234F0855|nr:integrase family protein [Vogesella indigofera]MDC7710052.1 integrase family protein [Vogesella indigofera]